MGNLVRKKQVDQIEFSGFFVEVGDTNYYPLSTNPSSYATTADLTSATGQVYTDLNTTSGDLNTSIQQTGSASNIYSDGVSGALSTRLVSSGAALESDVGDLSGHLNTVSGNLNTTINTASGALNTEISTTSGDLVNYVNSVSGDISTEISNISTVTEVDAIASGNNFNFSGVKVFNSEIKASRINFSGVSAANNITLVGSSNEASIVGNQGAFVTYSETGVGSNSSSLFAVNDSAGLPFLELFDDYKLIFGRNAKQAIIVSGVSQGYVIMPNLPTSSSGLPSNTLYNDGGTLKIT
jgi:hypothetical protein